MSGGRYGTFEERFAEEVGRLSLKSIFLSNFDVKLYAYTTYCNVYVIVIVISTV